jgi:release factor glutamine methyltransferase
MIYVPSEDSLLISETLRDYVNGKNVIDVCASSGFLSECSIKYGAKTVLAVDINESAVRILKKKGITAIKSNIFSNIKKNKKFDVIICNPPYLPYDKREDEESSLITSGGKNGDEFLCKFIVQAEKFLSNEGTILIVLSSLTPKKRIEKLLAKKGFLKKVIASQKIFMELLEVWEIKRWKI